MDTPTTNQFRFTYNGSKADFIAAGRPAIADEYGLIVFIKDTANNGAGSCVYAQGMYFADFASLIAALAYVKGVNVGGSNYTAAAGGGFLKFEAADPATVAVTAGSDGIKIGLTSTFVDKVDTLVNQVTAIAADYLTSADKTELEGKITAASGDVTTLAGRVSTLEGDDAGSSVRTIVQDEVAKQLTSENISESFDTLKEIAEWLSEHPDDVTAMNEAIAANTAAITLLNSDDAGSVNAKVAAALAEAKEYTDDKIATVYTKTEVDAMFAWGSLD